MQGAALVRVVVVGFALLLGMARADAAEPITIGFGMALAGGIAANGRAALVAIKLWEADINAGGLLDRPAKLIYYDDQSTPSGIPALYTKLLDVDKVDLVVSGYGTNVTVPAMPIVMGHNRLFMALFTLAVNSEFNYKRISGCFQPAHPRVLGGRFPKGSSTPRRRWIPRQRRWQSWGQMPSHPAMRSRALWRTPGRRGWR